jgi:DNA polymerase-3 subunit chi
MTEVLFVEVTTSRLELRACEIAEEIYGRGETLQILASDPTQASRLDDLLWAFRPDSFIPHGMLEPNGSNPGLPVVISTREHTVPGIRHLLMLEFSSPEFLRSFTQAIHLVVVDNRERREASRKYWVQLRNAGFVLRHQKV